MKRLSILVLVILVLAALLAACAPTTPPEEPHEHSYATEWSSNETHHWYANTCNHGADVVSGKAEHVDAAEDGKCDVCDYVLFYTATVTAPDFVTVSGDLKGKGEVSFTATAPAYYTLSVEGATQVGNSVVANGVVSYTFKANLTADADVTITAEKIAGVNVLSSTTGEFLPEGDAKHLPSWKNVTTTVTISVPAAGTYQIVTFNLSSGDVVTVAEEGVTTFSNPYTFVADAAGEYTFNAKCFNMAEGVESLEFTVSVCDLYETEVELDGLTGNSGYLIPALLNNNTNSGVTLKVTIPTAGIYTMTANGLLISTDAGVEYIFQATSDNYLLEVPVFVDEYHEGPVAELNWEIKPLVYNTVGAPADVVVGAGMTYPMSFTAPAAGKYMIVSSTEGIDEFYTWNGYGFGYPYLDVNKAIELAEGETIEFAYKNSDYSEFTLNVGVVEFVDSANALPMGDISLTDGLATEYTYVATEAGKLVFVTTDFSGGSVDIKYYLNNNKDGEWINGNSTYEISLAIGDVVTVVINSEGQGSMNVSWTAGGSEGGDDEGGDLGTINNPYIFGGENIVLSADMMNPTFITIPAGMTVYIDGDASFYADENGNEYVGTSVSPTVDTTYTICANTWAGAIIMVTTTAPEGGDDEGGDDVGGGDAPAGQLPLGENINFEPDDVNVTYTYMADAYGKLTLTAGIPPMGTITITYSINGDDPVTLANGVATEIELYAYDMITVVVTNNGAYQSLTTAWEYLELPLDPDGTMENPYIFDGTVELYGWVEFSPMPTYFVMVKGGTTAYILGNAMFNDGFDSFTSVSPAEDTLYAVITTSTDMWGEDFTITAVAPAEGGDGSEFNPYIFDGTADIEYSIPDSWAPIFVTVKGGVTAYLTGDAYFCPSFGYEDLGTSVTPAEDTVYWVFAYTDNGATGVITATAPEGGDDEGGDEPENPGVIPSDPLSVNDSWMINGKDEAYSYTAPTAGTLSLSQGFVMAGGNVVITVSVNGGEAVTLVPQVDPVDFVLEAGDVVVVTVTATTYSSITTAWVEGTAGGDEGGEDPVPPVEEEEKIVATFEFGPNRTEPVPGREDIYNGGQKNETYDMVFTYGQYSLVLSNLKTVYGGYQGMAHDSVGNSMIRVGTKNAGYFTFIAPEGVDKVVFYVGCVGTNDATIIITGYQEGAEVVIPSAEYSTDTGVYQAITVEVPEDRTITFTGKYSAINKIEYVSTGTVEGDANLNPEVGGNLLSKFDFGPNITEKLPESTEEGDSLFFAGTSQAKNAVVTLEDGNGNTLDITVGRTVSTGAYDAMGNSAIIVSTNGNDFGQFSFTVADNVDQVVFYVSGFGDTEGWFGINGRVYTVPTSANSGEYTAVVFDTSEVKTVAFLADRAYPVMIDAIELRTFDEIEPPVDPTPDPEPEQPAEPDGSQENPYIFDGTATLSGNATFPRPSYFVMVKAGVTAYIHGDAAFGNDYGETFASVTPEVDTVYAVVANTFEGAEFSISTEAPVVEEPSEPETPAPTVETTLPKIGKSIEFNSNGEYTYVAETAGNFNISQGGVATMMGGSYANVYVRINNGETIALEKNAARDFTLEAGDVVYITLEADAYSSFKVIWTAA